jgi:hypothetical protein
MRTLANLGGVEWDVASDTRCRDPGAAGSTTATRSGPVDPWHGTRSPARRPQPSTPPGARRIVGLS